MRIRGGHVAGTIVLAITAFVLYTTMVLPPAPENEPVQTASLPPIDADPSLVPVIELAAPELNFGTISNHGIAQRTMTVFNRGKAPLVISDVRSSCACSLGRVSEKTKSIPAGGEGIIEVVIDPRRIPGFHSRKTLTVFSNDPENGSVKFDVVTNIEPELDILPEKVVFGSVPKGRPHTQSIRIRQRQQAPLEIASAVARGAVAGTPWTDVRAALRTIPEIEWSQPGRAEYEIEVTLPPDTPAGPLRRVIEIATNVERVPRLRLNVEANIEAPYTVSPAYPRLVTPRALRDGGPLSAALTITGSEAIEIDRIAVDVPNTSVARRPGDAPNSIILEVNVGSGATPGILEGLLRFVVRTGNNEYTEWTGIRASVPPPA